MSEDGHDKLAHLLEETRIVLPGAELLAGFLITLPFSDRFGALSSVERVVFLVAFFLTLAALACFMTPSVYHRIAHPISDKDAFKRFANRFIVAGLVPFTCALSLSAYLVTSIVVNTLLAVLLSGVTAALLVTLWWIVPYVRVHSRP